MERIQIDGTSGGGQILRSALSLSALTGRPFVIDQIRQRRDRPGLMRQHLTAVRAAATICDAVLQGDELGSTRLEFVPGEVRAGAYRFAIGSAGSACLVLQTVLPPLLALRAASTLSFEGGTHNPLAPPYPYLDQVYFPLLERMGAGVERRLLRAGFYPAGGGEFEVRVVPPAQLAPCHLLARGALHGVSAQALICNLPHHIAQRELSVVQARLGLEDPQLQLRTPDAHGPGNVLLLIAEYEHATEMVVGFGEKNVRAERVAERACRELLTFMRADVPVGEHLADQLLIPFAMAGSGSFRAQPLSAHARSNIAVIEQFLPIRFAISPQADGNALVSVEAP